MVREAKAGKWAPVAKNKSERAAVSGSDRMSAGQSRAIIEHITPAVDGGRFAAKGSVGEAVHVEVDGFVDGHDKLGVALFYRRATSSDWTETDFTFLINDRWTCDFPVAEVGLHEFKVAAWVDPFATWRFDLRKRVDAGQNVAVDLQIGASLVDEAAKTNKGATATALRGFAMTLRSNDQGNAQAAGFDENLEQIMRLHAPRLHASESAIMRVWVDCERARFSSWYEFFPRSAAIEPGQHGTLRDVERRLDYVASMGFDVLYLPPIHPIGRAFRKGRNNTTTPEENDVGSPWAIGGPEGGHDAIHPHLGTFEDFDRLVAAAKAKGIDLALDIAFQCSPDHPYVKAHPQWFRHRPDGSIQYAENPPKKYQDIYPFDFECADWQALWQELLRVMLHWVDHGVRIFRVDNPHTKPFGFWEWAIAQVKQREPEVLFLAEAFTRPKVMYRLAKLGFTQSYTYFAWRNDSAKLTEYLTELTTSPVVDFFRPNVWPNTPDILPDYLQTDARSAYIVRAIIAATLCGNYGIYGPAFELMDHRPVCHGSEEYLDSEKYQIRKWDLTRQDSLAELMARLNRIRRDHPALQHDRGLVFHRTDNPQVLCYSKQHGDSTIFVAANTDPYHTQQANVDVKLPDLGLHADEPYEMHDLLSGGRYRWQGYWNFVKLDPGSAPAQIFALRRRRFNEYGQEYFV